MTNEEAKKYLESCVGDGTVEFVHQPIRTDVLATAISALEKQIPKKVEWTVDGSWGVKSKQPVCPICDCYLTKFQFFGDGNKITFCEFCGHAIDWSE